MQVAKVISAKKQSEESKHARTLTQESHVISHVVPSFVS